MSYGEFQWDRLQELEKWKNELTQGGSMANTKKVTLHEDEIVIRRPDLMYKLEQAYKKGMETGEMMVGEILDIVTEEDE